MASQKTGIDWPKAPSSVQSRSSAEPGRTAAPIPSGTEVRTASKVATVASESVAGIRSSTSGRDGVL